MVNCKACFATVPNSILYMHLPVTSAVSYLFTELAECSVGPGTRCGARKLARTLRIIYIKNNNNL